MRIVVDEVFFETSFAGEGRVVQEALRIVDRRLKRNELIDPVRLSVIRAKLPIAAIISGEITEAAAANMLADQIVREIEPLTIPDPTPEEIEQRKTYFLFGNQLPTEAKSLDQLLIERMREESYSGDPRAKLWNDQALAILNSDPNALRDFNTREALIDDWIYAQGPNPSQKNPLAQLHDSYAKARKEAVKVLQTCHKAATSAGDYLTRVRAEMNAAAKGDDEQRKVAALLSRYLTQMHGHGSAHVRATNPELNTGDWEWQGAQLAQRGMVDNLPRIELPGGVPLLPEIGPKYLKRAKGPHAATAQLLAEQIVRLARLASPGDATGQYHTVESAIYRYRYSGNPDEALAAQILQRFMMDEKKKWAYAHVHELMKHKDQSGTKVNWDLMSDVADAKTNTPIPAGKLMHNRVAEAWKRIQEIVAPSVLNQVGPVKVRVHGGPAFMPEFMGGYRACYSGHDRTIHLGWADPTSVVMHEFGHHIEDQGGLGPWLGMQRILHKRSGGGDLSTLWLNGLDEQHYSGKMPVTGNYAAKYYEHGSTELTSMGLEYLYNPKTAAELYIRDPDRFLMFLGIARGAV